MTDIKIDFNNCDISIDKMFDIHDNQNVYVNNNVNSEKTTSTKNKKKISNNTKQKKIEDRLSRKPQTIYYYIHENRSILQKQQKRVDILFKKFTEWNWIDQNTRAEDFDYLFSGEQRYCNITWTSTSTVLTILLQSLLKKTYIQHQTGCSAKSLVENQFRMTANSDKMRLNDINKNRIAISLIILDLNFPLPESNNNCITEQYDISDAALYEVYNGQLRSTKGI